MTRQVTANHNPAERVRDKINLRRAIPLTVADDFPNRVIGELLNRVTSPREAPGQGLTANLAS